MEQGSSFLKEYRSISGKSEGFVFQVNFANGQDLDAILNKLVLFGNEVHGEDWTKEIWVNDAQFSFASAKLTQFMSESCDIFSVKHDGKLIGFYVLQFVFDSVCAVRAVFIEEKYRKHNIMNMCWNELIKNGITMFLFQTSKKVVPSGLANNKLKIKISENDSSITWKMEV